MLNIRRAAHVQKQKNERSIANRATTCASLQDTRSQVTQLTERTLMMTLHNSCHRRVHWHFMLPEIQNATAHADCDDEACMYYMQKLAFLSANAAISNFPWNFKPKRLRRLRRKVSIHPKFTLLSGTQRRNSTCRFNCVCRTHERHIRASPLVSLGFLA